MPPPVAAAVTLSLAEPLTAGLLGILILGERLSPQAMIGAALLLGGLLLLSVFNTFARASNDDTIIPH
ncbi:MAG TPA: hypothetical protein ENK24_06990 [Anaerolineae bacterium]|nr:hypothetical protein [Anaerolineae bacterium]